MCARLIGQDSLPIAEATRRKRMETQETLRAIYGAILQFYRDHRILPSTINAACDPAPEQCLTVDEGEQPTDFWGSPVLYAVEGEGFELRSAGPDRKAGNRDDLVIKYPLDRSISNRLAGCYRPGEGWWNTRPSVLRLDTLSAVPSRVDGRYSLDIRLPVRPFGLAPIWWPIGTDSVLFQWGWGTRLDELRLRSNGDTLRGRVDMDLDYANLKWHGMLTLIRTRCEG